jgi:hypothetical protein
MGLISVYTSGVEKSEFDSTVDDLQAQIDAIGSPDLTPVYSAIQVVQNDVNTHESRTDNPHNVTKAQVGLSNVDNTSDLNKPLSTLQDAAITSAINALKDGVSSPGDTLKKLYNLILGSFHEVSVANIAARDAYDAISGMHIFVVDDGDGKWALYKATTAGVGATYVKLSDPDLLNSVLTASQIKVAYESNPDTRAFTDALFTKLNGIAAGATVNSSDATLLARANHTGSQAISTVTGLQTALDAKELLASKDATGGYAGLTGFKLDLKNNAGTFTSLLQNTNTAIRNYTLQDRSGTLADDTDLALKLTKASNLSDLASASTARNNLGLGGASVLNVGTTAGTVAAGDDSRIKGFPITHSTTQTSMADSFSYYMGTMGTLPITTAGIANFARKTTFKRAGTITSVQISVLNATTEASTENVSFYCRVNDTTDYTLSTTIQFSATANGSKVYNISGLSIPIVIDDFIVTKINTPAWPTNPVNTHIQVTYNFD